MKTNHSVAARKRKKKTLNAAKGYWGERSRTHRRAAETLRRAYSYAYSHRRLKKRTFRSLWIVRINAAAVEAGTSYREFINRLKVNNILLSRDILSQIAAEHPEVFTKIVETAKK
ncbi:MAG: 50S ribosomal protein L20 [Candidatus Omnitrophica bacterium]|nr:50S ribosomal protein L20 [Candidatus Omnitrophota bacterium]